MTQQVAVLGLGTMGGRAAAGILDSGCPVVGYDPVEQARAAADAGGVRTVDTPEAAVDGADVVVVSVPRPDDVRRLAAGALAGAADGTVVVDLSTIDPATARAAAEDLAAHGVVYLDAPVLGRPAGCGAWTLLAGGPATSVELVRPLLEETIAKRVAAVGDVGTGSLLKILNNLMFGAINAVTAEALALCERSGVDMGVFVDAVADSGAATVSPLFRDVGARIAAGDHDPVFALALLEKDNGLARDVAAAVGLAAPITDAVCGLNHAAVRLGHGGRDSSAVVEVYLGDEAR